MNLRSSFSTLAAHLGSRPKRLALSANNMMSITSSGLEANDELRCKPPYDEATFATPTAIANNKLEIMIFIHRISVLYYIVGGAENCEAISNEISRIKATNGCCYARTAKMTFNWASVAQVQSCKYWEQQDHWSKHLLRHGTHYWNCNQTEACNWTRQLKLSPTTWALTKR